MIVAKGQKTAHFDSNGGEIKVGDVIKTGEGEYWDINTYLQAVPRHAAMAMDIRQFSLKFPHRIILGVKESENVKRVIGVPDTPKVTKKPKMIKPIANREKRAKPFAVADGYKVCAHCGELKETSAFSKSAKNPDGLQAWCKYCVNNYYKEKGTSRRKNKKILWK